MALSFKSAANGLNTTAGGTTQSCTLPVAPAAGDIIMVVGAAGSGAAPASLTITDGSGDTYTDSGFGILVGAGSLSAVIAKAGYFFNPTPGVTTITATIPANASNNAVEIYAWVVTGFVGTATAGPKHNANGNGTAVDSGGTGTLPSANTAAVAHGISGTAITAAGSGWSTGGTNINDGINAGGDIGEHQITASTTSINGTATQTTGDWSALVLTVYDAVQAAQVGQTSTRIFSPVAGPTRGMQPSPAFPPSTPPLYIGQTPPRIFQPGSYPRLNLQRPDAFPTNLNISASQGAYTLTGEPQTLTLTLASTAVGQTPPRIFQPGSYPRLNLQRPDAFPTNLNIVASQGTYTLTGQPQTMSVAPNPVGQTPPRIFRPDAGPHFNMRTEKAFASGPFTFTLTAAQGTYTLTGNAQTLAVGMPASQGTYTLTGEPQTMSVVPNPVGQTPYRVFQPGTYPHLNLRTEKAFPTKGQFTISAGFGTYTLTGISQTLLRGINIAAAQGTYTLTGNAQTLAVGMPAGQGTYTLTGEPQTLSVVPNPVGILPPRTFQPGSYPSLNLRRPDAFPFQTNQFNLVASQGTYTLTGQPQAFVKAVSINPTTGVYTLTGNGQVLSFTPFGTPTVVHGNPFFATMGPMTSLP